MIYVPSRVKRHKYKFDMDTGLNLVSLMDIFTTIVFFLLIYMSGEGESIQMPEIVSLPLSISTARPEPATTIYITTNEILVDNKKVATVHDILDNRDAALTELEREIESQGADRKEGHRRRHMPQGKVIIMGDKAIPFALLKKVMQSCANAGYPDIVLAVIQKE